MSRRFDAAIGGLFGLLACMAASPRLATAGTPCMVLGDASARVSSIEGVRSPVFETADCGKLRLVSGRALASWVAHDGKPQLVPITSSGVAQVPQPGSEERSVRVAWSELTSTRADQKPAYMRGMGGLHPVPVYVPRDGIEVPGTAAQQVQVRVRRLAQPAGQPQTVAAADGKPVRLGRDVLQAGASYRIEIVGGVHQTTLEWHVVDAARQAEVDSRLEQIAQQIGNPEQRDIVTAMLYDQLKLPTNLSLLAPRLRAEHVAVGMR